MRGQPPSMEYSTAIRPDSPDSGTYLLISPALPAMASGEEGVVRQGRWPERLRLAGRHGLRFIGVQFQYEVIGAPDVGVEVRVLAAPERPRAVDHVHEVGVRL